MPKFSVDNLAQFGYMPDAVPSTLPPNAFSFATNWRFNEAGYAEVTRGFSDAYGGLFLGGVSLGSSTTNASFMFTWSLPAAPALVYYDSFNRKMRFGEVQDVAGTEGFVEEDLTVTEFTHALRSENEWQATEALGVPIFNNGIEHPWVYSDDNTDKTIVRLNLWPAAQVVTFNAGSITRIESIIGTSVNTTEIEFTDGMLPVNLSIADVITLTNTGASDFNRTYTVESIEGNVIGTLLDSSGLNASGLNATTADGSFDDNPTCVFLTSYSAFLIGIGYEDPSNPDVALRGGPRTIAISDVFEAGGLPAWNFADSTIAQIFDLSLLTEGDLLSAYEQSGSLFVNTTTDVIIFTSNGDGTFNATAAPYPNGALTKRSTALVPNGQFNIGNRKMYIHDGSSTTPVGEGKFVESWFSEVDEGRYDEVQATYDPQSTSIWIKTPLTDGSNEMWIYNLSNDTLSRLDGHRDVKYMLFSATGIPSARFEWDDFTENSTWDTLPDSTWADFPPDEDSIYRNRLLSCGGRSIFIHDQGFTFNEDVIIATLRREDLRLINDTYSSVQISRILPHVYDATPGSSLTCRVGGSNAVNAPVVWSPTRTLSVDSGQKLDFRTTVKWSSYEFVSASSGQILSGYEIDYNQSGGR